MAAGTGRAAVRFVSTLRLGVICSVESGAFEDNPGSCPDQFFSRTAAKGTFSVIRIIHFVKFLKLVTTIAAFIFVSRHTDSFQTLSIIIIAAEGQTLLHFAQPSHPRLILALPFRLTVILR